MLHLITILGFSTMISVIAYMIQHGEIESGKNFSKLEEERTITIQEHPNSRSIES